MTGRADFSREALHVSNGDATDVPGTGLAQQVLYWRDVLHEGPVPAVGPEELRRIRAGFLVGQGVDDRAEAARMFLDRRPHPRGPSRRVVRAVVRGGSVRPVADHPDPRPARRSRGPPDRVARASVPLLQVEAADRPVDRDSRLRPTEAGARVLAGDADHVALNKVDRWIGGVRLRGRRVPWRWDEGIERVVEVDAERDGRRRSGRGR